MARKSRKAPAIIPRVKERNTVGYIRLSVSNKEKGNSIETQKRIIEMWCYQHEIPIDKFYIDNGYSGRNCHRPAFNKMLRDIADNKISLVIVKDLSRFGRNPIDVGYYIEIFLPSHKVGFCAINDRFETINGINNIAIKNDSGIRIPIINAVNEQIALVTKRNLEVILDMKAQNGMFIGPRAPFGYKKSETDHSQLVPDDKAAKIVKEIFDLAVAGTGINAIVRHLNNNNTPTPIQNARTNGLTGNFDDGNGSWNSRSVKNILSNITYTGVLVQGKEQRVAEGTHRALVDKDTFELIQNSFLERAQKPKSENQTPENILRGKVICGCCSGKLQRRFNRNHEWAFFSCITNNRLGADKCTGMYVREDEIFSALYEQIDSFVNEHFISEEEYQAHKRDYEKDRSEVIQKLDTEMRASMSYYEKLVCGEISEEEFTELMSVIRSLTTERDRVTAAETDYDEKYSVIQKLIKACRKEIPLGDIMEYIDEIVVSEGRSVSVKWKVLI